MAVFHRGYCFICHVAFSVVASILSRTMEQA